MSWEPSDELVEKCVTYDADNYNRRAYGSWTRLRHGQAANVLKAAIESGELVPLQNVFAAEHDVMQELIAARRVVEASRDVLSLYMPAYDPREVEGLRDALADYDRTVERSEQP